MENPKEIKDIDQKDSVQQRREKAPRIQKPRARKAPLPALPVRETLPYPYAKFQLKSALASEEDGYGKFRPRLGTFTLRRTRMPSSVSLGNTSKNGSNMEADITRIEIQTPGMICSARHGMVKHLSRDNVTLSKGVEWIHLPLEDFLEHPVPVPTYHPSSLPLHGFLTHPPSSHIISLSLRDPLDNQNMPANTNAFIQVRTVRGVRKVGVDDWVMWCKALRPDLVWAFVDAPKTLTGVPADGDGDGDGEGPEIRDIVPGEGRQTSQKRTMKSLDRTWLWVERLVRGLTRPEGSVASIGIPNSRDAALMDPPRPPIILPLMGGCDPRARAEFARGLVDKIDTPITDDGGKVIKILEDGIFGYAIELVDLPTSALSSPPGTSFAENANSVEESNIALELIHSSFESLSSTKLRIAHSPSSPHIILRLIAETGMDLFDVPWLAEAADLGIALDFQFPVPPPTLASGPATPIGHNLFEECFSMDFEPIGRLESSWPCHATFSSGRILHGKMDVEQWDSLNGESSSEETVVRAFTRAYIHHLLHTHEMGAYALLHLHNLATMDRFFKDVRTFMSQNVGPGAEAEFTKEIIRFYEEYELPDRLFVEARRRWKEVEDARGKGSLKRERDALRSAQGGEEGVPLFAVDDAHPEVGIPQGDTVAVLEAVEDQIPAPGSPVTVSSPGAAFPISSTKLVPLKRRRSSLETDSTPPRASKMNYFVASATVVSVPAATGPLFENVLQGLKYSINDSCQALFRPTALAGPAPSITCSQPVDASRSSECPSNVMNYQLTRGEPSEWPFTPALPSFLRPLPPADSIGTLEPLPALLHHSMLKPLPPIAGMDGDGGRLDQLRFHPFHEAPVMLDVHATIHAVPTPLVRLLTKMQEYNQEVLESKDAAALAKNAKKQLECELKRYNPSRSRDGKLIKKTNGDNRLNNEKPWSWRNSKLKKGTRRVERRMLESKTLSKVAQFAIRKGKWRRNKLRRLNIQETRASVAADSSHLEVHKLNIPPFASKGSSPMSICSILDLPVTSVVETSSDPPHTDRARSPSNDAFSISSTPPNIVSDLPSEDCPSNRAKLPDFQAVIEDAWKVVIAKCDPTENRSKSPDFQAAFDDAWRVVMATGADLKDRPKSQSAFEDAWNAVMTNGVDLGTPPHQQSSPRGSCSPIPGLTPSLWAIPSEEQVRNQDAPSLATPLKRKAPPSPTWSPPQNDTWSSPITRSANLLGVDPGISLHAPTQPSSIVPGSKHDRATPNLRLLLSPKPTLARPLYNRYSEDIALPTPIDDNGEQLPPITPLDLLEQPMRSNQASDANSLFDGDLSDAEESVVSDTCPSRRWHPRTPSPISARAITFTRTPESRQLPTPSSLSPPPPPRFPIRLPSIRSIAPMYLSNEVRDMLYKLEAEAQEPSAAKSPLKAQLWREKKAGKNGELGGRVQLDRGPVIPISPAALGAVINNAFAALRLRDTMTKKDDDAMVF